MFASGQVAAQDWKGSLNSAQLEAVTAADGPVLVIAGAGTGKTWTLACRVAHLIEQGVPPERILLLTFSRRAAREMLSRAGRLVDQNRTGKVWGGTFHAIANRLLRLYGRPIGLAPDFSPNIPVASASKTSWTTTICCSTGGCWASHQQVH